MIGFELNNVSYDDAIASGNLDFGAVGNGVTIFVDPDGDGSQTKQALVELKGVSIAEINQSSNFTL